MHIGKTEISYSLQATILNKPVIAKPFKTTGETIWTCPTALKPVSER